MAMKIKSKISLSVSFSLFVRLIEEECGVKLILSFFSRCQERFSLCLCVCDDDDDAGDYNNNLGNQHFLSSGVFFFYFSGSKFEKYNYKRKKNFSDSGLTHPVLFYFIPGDRTEEEEDEELIIFLFLTRRVLKMKLQLLFLFFYLFC
jgi:hypothetical protein